MITLTIETYLLQTIFTKLALIHINYNVGIGFEEITNRLACARLAQLVRSLTTNQKVPGSIPVLVEG